MSSIKSYFEHHAHHYHKEPGLYSSYAKLIPHKDKIKILDVACGDGEFIKEMISTGIKAEFIGIDLSHQLLSSAKENLKFYPTNLCIVDAFNMPFRPSYKFDVIHLDALLHHLIGRTKGKSTKLVKRMLSLLIDKLSDDGILMVDEYYYNSYIIQSLTSSIIFYTLKTLNFFHIDVNRIMREIHLGLEVNFLTENQIYGLIGEHVHDVQAIRKKPHASKRTDCLFLLKESGRISLIGYRKK